MVPSTARAILDMSVADFTTLLLSDRLPEGIEIGETSDSKCIVTAQGISAHAADPAKGKNAIYILAAFLENIQLPDEKSNHAMKSIAALTGNCYGKSCGDGTRKTRNRGNRAG